MHMRPPRRTGRVDPDRRRRFLFRPVSSGPPAGGRAV